MAGGICGHRQRALIKVNHLLQLSLPSMLIASSARPYGAGICARLLKHRDSCHDSGQHMFWAQLVHVFPIRAWQMYEVH